MSIYNNAVVDEAAAVAAAAQRKFFGISAPGAVTLSAIAGAGKSHFVVDSVKKCRRRGIHVAVAAPTNEQVFSLVRSIADNEPRQPVGYVHANDIELPTWARRANVTSFDKAHQATGELVVVGTIAKLGSARNPWKKSSPALGAFDALIMDEGYQANAASYFAIADIAPKHLVVGDGGQIYPFTPVGSGTQWRGLIEDPLQTAMDILHTNHPETPSYRFPITRRLDDRGCLIARCFYPASHVFGAAVADGVRRMQLTRSIATTQREKAIDKGLSLAAHKGWAHLELSAHQALVCDPETAHLIVDLVERLLSKTCLLFCEHHPDGTMLRRERIAVSVSHNDQKAMMRTMLDRKGLNGIVVDTANKLQGLEFDVSICWHPMAGLDEADEFHLESGRLCVMCTRHRHACIIVGRQGDRELVEGLPPATPAWPESAPDRILSGWEVHQSVFAALTPFRVSVD
jgi:hypothetical protein